MKLTKEEKKLIVIGLEQCRARYRELDDIIEPINGNYKERHEMFQDRIQKCTDLIYRMRTEEE